MEITDTQQRTTHEEKAAHCGIPQTDKHTSIASSLMDTYMSSSFSRCLHKASLANLQVWDSGLQVVVILPL